MSPYEPSFDPYGGGSGGGSFRRPPVKSVNTKSKEQEPDKKQAIPSTDRRSSIGRFQRRRSSENASSSTIGHPAPPWMVNYADLMTEMVCFFVILYALGAALNKNVRDVRQQVEQMMKQENMQGQVQVKKDGVAVTMQEGEHMSFFESGSPVLSAEGLKMLDKIAPVLKEAKGDVIVEGHTDNIPLANIQNGITSNWELSTARATNVVRYLIDQKGFTAKRMAAIGFGENRPIAENDTPENRSKNRRVVFFIKTGG